MEKENLEKKREEVKQRKEEIRLRKEIKEIEKEEIRLRKENIELKKEIKEIEEEEKELNKKENQLMQSPITKWVLKTSGLALAWTFGNDVDWKKGKIIKKNEKNEQKRVPKHTS